MGSVPLEDKLNMMNCLHVRQPSWGRYFQQHIMFYSGEVQVNLHRIFVAKFTRACRRRGHSSQSSSASSSESEEDNDFENNDKLPLLMEAMSLLPTAFYTCATMEEK